MPRLWFFTPECWVLCSQSLAKYRVWGVEFLVPVCAVIHFICIASHSSFLMLVSMYFKFDAILIITRSEWTRHCTFYTDSILILKQTTHTLTSVLLALVYPLLTEIQMMQRHFNMCTEWKFLGCLSMSIILTCNPAHDSSRFTFYENSLIAFDYLTSIVNRLLQN